MSARPVVAALAILLGALAVKLGFAIYLHGRFYLDVDRALNFALQIEEGTLSIDSAVINSKTFLGPVLWLRLYHWLGAAGLIAFNLGTFVALFGVQYRLGRGRYSWPTTLVALVLFAFYVGTNRNVVAGEPDDNLAALLFGVGVLIYVDRRRALVAGLCMGAAFLFKFWVAIFCIGLVLRLALQRRGGDLIAVLVGMAIPFALLNGIDGMASWRALFLSVDIQHGYSSWEGISFKLLSTGMLPMVVLSAWAWWQRRNDTDTLYLLVSTTYCVYAVVNRDAFAASFVMMVCLMFSSFLLAECLRHGGYLLGRGLRGGEVAIALAAYVLLTTAITYRNLYSDTQPIVLRSGRAAAAEMFPWNF